MIKKVTILSHQKFPSGDASAIRYVNLASIFRRLNYEVVAIGMGNTPYGEYFDFEYGKYVSLRQKSKSIFHKVFQNLLREKRLIEFAIKHHNNSNIFFVCSGLSKKSRKTLSIFAAKNKITLIYNVMEWFSKKQYFLNGLFSIPYHKNNSFIRQFKKQDGKIVAISRYLNEYFSSKGIQSLYLPFVFDENHFATLPRKSHKGINIFYIGRSRNKDDLYRMLVGFDIAKEKIDGKVNVFIVGENRKTIRKARNNNLLHDWIVVKGEVNNQEALELLSNADYTVLLRPPHERFAKAGFPTKVAESLFAGVPVITNLTSNLSDYLVDGANSIIVNDYSAKAFSEAIIRAVSVTGDDYENMRIEARKTALDNLEAGLFSEDFRKFLNDN